jgi:hypothetical protein
VPHGIQAIARLDVQALAQPGVFSLEFSNARLIALAASLALCFGLLCLAGAVCALPTGIVTVGLSVVF